MSRLLDTFNDIMGTDLRDGEGIGPTMLVIAERFAAMEQHNNQMQISNVERMSKLERRIIELETSLRAANIQLLYDLQGKNYVELDERLKKVEKRNTALPHWTDMPR